MKRSLFFIALIAGMLGVAIYDSSAQAQKKDAKNEAAGKVLISAGKDGKYRFQVRNADDEYICGSTAYATEKEAAAGVEELKKVLATAKVTVTKKDAKAKEKE